MRLRPAIDLLHPRGLVAQRTRRSRPASRRRAFTLVLALGLFVIATLMVSWNARRMFVYINAVESHLGAYARHHEELAVADICRVWLTKLVEADRDNAAAARNDPAADPRSMLERFAATPEADFELLLPEGSLVQLFVRDGQGTALANLGLATSPEQERLMLQTLVRLPDDRPDLIRSSGPIAVSLRAAETPVLAAIAGPNAELLDALLAIRNDPALTGGNLRQLLARERVNVTLADDVLQMLTLDPQLWVVDVEVRAIESLDDPDGLAAARGDARWYQFLIAQDATSPVLLERRRQTQEQFQRSRTGAAPGA